MARGKRKKREELQTETRGLVSANKSVLRVWRAGTRSENISTRDVLSIRPLYQYINTPCRKDKSSADLLLDSCCTL